MRLVSGALVLLVGFGLCHCKSEASQTSGSNAGPGSSMAPAQPSGAQLGQGVRKQTEGVSPMGGGPMGEVPPELMPDGGLDAAATEDAAPMMGSEMRHGADAGTRGWRDGGRYRDAAREGTP